MASIWYWPVTMTRQSIRLPVLILSSVLRSGKQLRIIARLVRIHDDYAVWSGRFDRELTNVVAIQDEISRGIVNSLRLQLGRGRRRYETSIEAYDLYLRDRSLLRLPGQLPPGSRRSRPVPFQDAIAKDPAFAPAYAGLAEAYAYLAFTGTAQADDMVKMRAAAGGAPAVTCRGKRRSFVAGASLCVRRLADFGRQV